MRGAAVILLVLFCTPWAHAEVLHSRESALRLAFPDADRVEKRDFFLSDEQAARAGALAGSAPASPLVTVYIGWKDGVVTGYALIDTHRVRTLPETLLVVVGSDGRVQGVHVLAFHEPAEYAAPAEWLRQFDDQPLSDRLSLRGDVAGITGATLTANAITAAVRRALAACAVGIEPAARGGPR